MLYNLNNIDKIFYNNKEYSSIYIKNKEIFTNEKLEEFIILYGGNSSGVRFLDPKTLNQLYYLDTGFPVFSIAYIKNDAFAVSSGNIGDMSIYIYKLNKDNNNFELKDTISEINGVELEVEQGTGIKQTVFYYNNYLYCFSVPKTYEFSIKAIYYDSNTFSIRMAKNCNITDKIEGFEKGIYYVSSQGHFQIIDNYFSVLGNGRASIYKILSENSIQRIGNYNSSSLRPVYPLKDEKYLLLKNGLISGKISTFAYLREGNNDISTIDSNGIFYFNSRYSKFSYFNNKYYISGGENAQPIFKGIVEYDNENQTAKLLTPSMNMGSDGDLDSIIVSSKGNFYLKGSTIIKSYDSKYNLLIEKDNSLYSDYKVIDTVSL